MAAVCVCTWLACIARGVLDRLCVRLRSLGKVKNQRGRIVTRVSSGGPGTGASHCG